MKKKKKTNKIEFSKRAAAAILLVALFDVQLCILAVYFDKEAPVEIAVALITEIVGVFLTYCVKAYFGKKQKLKANERSKKRMNWELIINAASLLVLALIFGGLVPVLKSKMTEAEFDKLKEWAKIAVEAAEMIYKTAGSGMVKKSYVIEFLKGIIEKSKLIVSDEELNNLIESAVLEMKREG